MRLRLLWCDGREDVVDKSIGFNTNGKRLSKRNPWPVHYIGQANYAWDGTKTSDVLPGKWQIIGEESDQGRNRLIVRQVAP